MANANKIPSPVLSLPPDEYDPLYMNNLIRLLNYYITQQDNPGAIRASTSVVFKDLPTSATDLEVGALWNNSGVLNIKT